MKTTHRLILISVLLGALLSQTAQAASTTISATVAPVRIVIVEANRIAKIDSNTAIDVDPQFVTKDGRQLASTTELRSLYQQLLPRLDRQRYGTIYEYQPPDRGLVGHLQASWKKLYGKLVAFGAAIRP